MINNFLTVVIPCMNDIKGVKKTIENLTRKTKISGTSILVLDFGSTDGSPQYVTQVSSEMLKIVRIESIRIEKGESINDVINTIKTGYVLTINPGSTFNDMDAILKSVNSILTDDKYPVIYLKPSNPLNNLIARFTTRNRIIGAILSKRDIVKNISFDYEKPIPEITLDKNVLSSGIKIGGFTDS